MSGKTRVHPFPDVDTDDGRNTITATVDMWDDPEIPDRHIITVAENADIDQTGITPWLTLDNWPINMIWVWALIIHGGSGCEVTADLLHKLADTMDQLDHLMIGVDE